MDKKKEAARVKETDITKASQTPTKITVTPNPTNNGTPNMTPPVPIGGDTGPLTEAQAQEIIYQGSQQPGKGAL